MDTKSVITPEQQIENVINSMKEYMDGPPFNGRVQIMRQSLSQLSDMWEKYQRGELLPIDNEIPF